MFDHINAVSLRDSELDLIVGGIKVSGTLIKAFSTAMNSILDMGRSFGTAIRRIAKRRLCSV